MKTRIIFLEQVGELFPHSWEFPAIVKTTYAYCFGVIFLFSVYSPYWSLNPGPGSQVRVLGRGSGPWVPGPGSRVLGPELMGPNSKDQYESTYTNMDP